MRISDWSSDVCSSDLVGGGQAVGVVLDPEALSVAAELAQHLAQRAGRLGLGPVDPDADVLDRGSLLGLAQVGRARQQHEAAVGAEIEALEEDVAEGVVAGQVVHALMAENMQDAKARTRERGGGE